MLVAASGWSGKKNAGATLRRFSILFVVAIDVEFLLGLLLYFGASPITKMAFQNMAAAMKDHEMRFFTVEHAVWMLLAVIFAHLGGALSRKGRSDLTKYRAAAICYSISLLLMLVGIPWWRPFLRVG
jgi:cell division protein FtsW (lipid II flippase)